MMRRLRCLWCGRAIQLDKWTLRHFEEKGTPANVQNRRDTYFCADGCAIAYGVNTMSSSPKGLGRVDALRKRYPGVANG